jgi:hypothetical protein
VFSLTALLTAGLLPADIRAQYGFEWNDRRERRFRRAVRCVRGARRLLPRPARMAARETGSIDRQLRAENVGFANSLISRRWRRHSVRSATSGYVLAARRAGT